MQANREAGVATSEEMPKPPPTCIEFEAMQSDFFSGYKLQAKGIRHVL